MIIAAMCMTSIMASAQKTIRVSTDKTDLVMQVSPKGRLYQVYLGDLLKEYGESWKIVEKFSERQYVIDAGEPRI